MLPDSIEADLDEIAALAAYYWKDHGDASAADWDALTESAKCKWRDIVKDIFHAMKGGREAFDGREDSASFAIYAHSLKEPAPLIPQADLDAALVPVIEAVKQPEGKTIAALPDNDAPQVEALGKPKRGKK